jgi:hypothetical protein
MCTTNNIIPLEVVWNANAAYKSVVTTPLYATMSLYDLDCESGYTLTSNFAYTNLVYQLGNSALTAEPAVNTMLTHSVATCLTCLNYAVTYVT